MTTPASNPPVQVLAVEAVRWAIETLSSQRANPFILAYLLLRVRAIETGSSSNITPRWTDLRQYLKVEGGPPGKPLYRPLMHRVKDPSGYWLNQNLAGSFATSSLREGTAPLKVVDITGSNFSLKSNHAQLAREHLLFGEAVPAVALGAFLYRDFGLHKDDSPLQPSDLIEVFRHEFRFQEQEASDEDFNILFDTAVPRTVDSWFDKIEVNTSELKWIPQNAPVRRTAQGLRELTADDLGIGVNEAMKTHASNRPDDPPIAEDDPLLREVLELLDVTGGVIFTGPPGTSKTWYAAKIGNAIVEYDQERIRFVQFHPSYQYEDFMKGFVPRESGEGFELKSKHFVEMCEKALKQPDRRFVLVIDELSRGDPGRVFGEALTYVERSKRGMPFKLASGDECTVPPNLMILATMNPLDRGVDEVDAAFERRFAKIAMDPDREILGNILDSNGVIDPLRRRILGFFAMINGKARTNPQSAIGHTYFVDVSDEVTLRRVWAHQLRFLIEKAYRLDPDGRTEVERHWERIFEPADMTKERSTSGGQAEDGIESREVGSTAG